MIVASPPSAGPTGLAEILDRLGGISADRVRLSPPPGSATVADVIRIQESERRLCELVDGVLVEKSMGYEESMLALAIASALRAFVIPANLGVVSGEAGMLQLFPGLVRIPDVAYASWDRFPGRRLTRTPVPAIVPELAVEVLSVSNTVREMDGKRREYFASGVLLFWSVDPRTRTVEVFTSADQPDAVLRTDEVLDGGAVLGGFSLSLADLFGELDRAG